MFRIYASRYGEPGGPGGDLDEWCERVGGDELYGWESARRLLNGVENYQLDGWYRDRAPTPNPGLKLGRYVKADRSAGDHGFNGRVSTEFSLTVRKGDAAIIDAWTEYGWPRNMDLNSGSLIGGGVLPAVAEQGSIG